MADLAPIPEVGEMYWFYANDQVKKETELPATVVKVIPFWESGTKMIYKYDDYLQEVVAWPLMDIWLELVPEEFWLLSDETDYFIELSIPDICPQNVYAARDTDGGWRVFETQTSKQFGILDITGELYSKLHEDLPE